MTERPRIVNIINFIRACEPRNAAIDRTRRKRPQTGGDEMADVVAGLQAALER